MDGLPVIRPATYDNGDRSDFHLLAITSCKPEKQAFSPPLALILPLNGTTGTTSSSNNFTILSISSHLTALCPLTRELARINIAPRTHDSGIDVDINGSLSGSGAAVSSFVAASFAEIVSSLRRCLGKARTPAAWCCKSASPSAS